jgi:hypothetical protein
VGVIEIACGARGGMGAASGVFISNQGAMRCPGAIDCCQSPRELSEHHSIYRSSAWVWALKPGALQSGASPMPLKVARRRAAGRRASRAENYPDRADAYAMLKRLERRKPASDPPKQ